MSRWAHIALMFVGLCLWGCGYHVAGHTSQLPTEVHTIAIPAFKNQTPTYRIEQIVTAAVVREFIGRTHYRIVNEADDATDATLHGTVTSAGSLPLTYDSRTGKVNTVLAAVVVKLSLTDRHNKVLFENSLGFRDQYQIAGDPSSFFQEQSPALERLSRDLARSLVTDVLEAY